MKLNYLYESLKNDIAAVAAYYNVNIATAEGGKTGLATMHNLLTVVSRNRAYDDAHPAFAQNVWERVLPYDGREYCFYYGKGCDDTHLFTALRKIKLELSA